MQTTSPTLHTNERLSGSIQKIDMNSIRGALNTLVGQWCTPRGPIKEPEAH
jgi:hypothetical protein